MTIDTRGSITAIFRPESAGPRLVLTEQGAYLLGFDDPKLREKGPRDSIAALNTALRWFNAVA